MILESALFQRQLNHYVKLINEDELPVLFDPLYRILQNVSPILIQFKHTELPSHFRWLAKARNGALAHFANIARPYAISEGMDDLSLISAYYSRIQKVSVNFAQKFPGPVLVVNQPRNDWVGSFDRICRKLRLPVRKPVRIPRNLASQLAGTYQRIDGLELVIIDAKRGRLSVRHDRDLKLIDPEQLLFFVDNRPDEIRFESAPGAASKLRMGGGSMFGSGSYRRKIPDRFTVDRVFVKLANSRGF